MNLFIFVSTALLIAISINLIIALFSGPFGIIFALAMWLVALYVSVLARFISLIFGFFALIYLLKVNLFLFNGF